MLLEELLLFLKVLQIVLGVVVVLARHEAALLVEEVAQLAVVVEVVVLHPVVVPVVRVARLAPVGVPLLAMAMSVVVVSGAGIAGASKVVVE